MAADNIVKLENINAPRFRNEWSPTTVVALLTLIGKLILQSQKRIEEALDTKR